MVCSRWLHLFNSASTPVPIHLLRYPDRELPAKPLQAERINPFFQWRLCAATGTIFASARPEATGKTIASGTDKSVPYMVRCKTQHRTCVTRNVTVSSNVPNRATAKLSSALMLRVAPTVSSAVPNRATRDNRIGRCVNSPLKSKNKRPQPELRPFVLEK